MIARPTPPRIVQRRRVPAMIAGLLAVLGAVLLTVASCSSQPGAPEPSAAAAGVIDRSELSSSAASSSPTSDTVPTQVSDTGSGVASTPDPTPETTAAPLPATTTQAPAPAPAPSSSTPMAPYAAPLPISKPVSLAIPAIGVTSTLLDLGLNSDGTIEVPPVNEPDSKAGWYDQSPTPGTLGPAILLGHIDSKAYGPGVFYDLGSLNPGDMIDVTREDGTVAEFQVDGVRSYSKADFPTLSVYGNLDHAGLRLITCGGVFNNDTGHYENNTVVFASMVGSRAA